VNRRTIFGAVLLAIGLGALGWIAYVNLGLHEVQDIPIMPPPANPKPQLLHAGKADPLGRISIPRLRIKATILEGTESDVLRIAAGHVRTTALPGSDGNVAIAAHRDTLFRGLGSVRAGDAILVTSPVGTFKYVVERTEIVGPKEVGILKPTLKPELTLITCYPFHFIGPAPKRFIVHASLDNISVANREP
jgi:sortase A